MALKHAPQVNGIYMGAEKGDYSFRNYGEYLLLGGMRHRTGKNAGSYEALESAAKKWFPRSQKICCWSAQDCMTLDKIPYIGQYSKKNRDWYVATGFQKWGMTTAITAALIFRDLTGIVMYKGKKAGIYKDMEGENYAIDVRCPHLGCQLEWNAAELSWDCPCHASRFDYCGNLLNNPAQKNI